jgi:DNA-binding winged helix-turn-helix (wHTH) protein/tetratricopeptide (TPR) repeat protein
MPPSSLKPGIVKFGLFEADLESLLLTKQGLRVKIQEQPFRLLALLLERSGEIITREEIRQKLWAADTFVEFDDGLNTAIKKLRTALGDSSDNPRFIETVPRRGYRFLAPVTISAPTEPSAPRISLAPAQLTKPSRSKTTAISLLTLAVVSVAMILWVARHRRPSIGEKDSILLADFENNTGEPILDGAMKEAAAVELGQSPFLNIVSSDRVRETLRFMSRSPDEHVEAPLAREVCERIGAKAYIAGSVNRIGTGYVFALKAVNCADGTSIARESAIAKGKEALLPALDQTAAKVRRELGESLASIQKFDVHVEDATTSSLEALKAYSLGTAQTARGAVKDAIPFFDHAIELDPNFAMAYARRGAAYNTLGELDRAASEFRRAYALRANLSEREKLFLTVRYEDSVIGDTNKAIETYEMWRQLYPRDIQPYNGLSARYQIVGKYEEAAEAAREGLRLQSNSFIPYANLASSYEALNRFDEAKQVCAEAAAAQHDSLYIHQILFDIAFLQKDKATMEKELSSAKGTLREADILTGETEASASLGKLRQARQEFERVFAIRRSNGLDDHTGYTMAAAAVIEADFGNQQTARNEAKEALRLGRGLDARETAAEVFSIIGDDRQALALVDELHTRFPLHVPLNPASLASVVAAVEIHRGNPAKAVQVLEQAKPYDLSEFSDLNPIYIRGLAYLRMRSGKEAASEFQKYLDHSGINTLFPRHSLALLGLARAYVLMKDTARARKAYEDFLALWSEADPDIPILLQAKSEVRNLSPI